MTELSLTKQEKIGIVTALMQAKQSHDIDALLALYHPDCILEQPSLGIRSCGHEQIRPGLEAFARHFPDYERSFEGFAEDNETLVCWGHASMTLTGEIGGVKPNGARSKVMTFVTFKFDKGRIIHEGHYWDLATIARTSGVPAELFTRSKSV